MKVRLCLGLAAALALARCGVEPRVSAAQAPQQSVAEENARLKRELDEANRKLELQGQYTADATRTLNELQEHLATISSLEGEVRGGTEEGQPLTKTRREKMLGAVQQMQNEIVRQEELIAGFRKRDEQYTERVAELGQAIAKFERVVATKNEEIARLRRDLETMSVRVEKLTEDSKVKEAEIVQQHVALDAERRKVDTLQREARAGGFIVASVRTLLKQQLIVQERVLLSRVWKVSPALDPEKLHHIDIDTMRQLSIYAPRQKLEIISPHPPGSYTLVPESPEQTLLTIIDPDRFWTTTRYLVIGIH